VQTCALPISAVSKTLRQLIDKGLVEVKLSKSDGRQRDYQLTRRGRRTMDELRDARALAIEQSWQKLDRDEIRRFTAFGNLLAQALTEHANTISQERDEHGNDAVRESLRPTHGPKAPVGAISAVDGAAPGARSDLAASLQHAERARAQRAASRSLLRHGGPQRPDVVAEASLPGRPGRRHDGRARRQRREARHSLLFSGRLRAGHRARDRSRKRPDAARHDDLLRRLAHVDAWSVRRARLRHRHLAGA